MKFEEKTIGKIFNFIGEENLTEENCYSKLGDFPVYSGQTENGGVIFKINTYKEEKPCLTFTTYGSAGRLYYRSGKFTIGRNCMGLRVKKEFKDKINLKWFLYTQGELFKKYRKGDKKGQGLLNKSILFGVKFKIPNDLSYQNSIANRYERLDILNRKVGGIINHIKSLKSRPLIKPKKASHNIKVPVKKIFTVVSGNSGLTEDYIYSRLLNKEKSKEYKVLSSSTLERTYMGGVDKGKLPNGKDLIVFENKEGLLVVRNGEAGKLIYLPEGNYSLNDHAYILYLKKEYENKIALKWIIYQYQNLFIKFSSSSDNGTWNKTNFMKHATIDIPSKQDQQKIISYYEKLDLFEKLLFKVKNKIDELFIKELRG